MQFPRVLVEVDVTKPLVREINIEVEGEGKDFVEGVKYEFPPAYLLALLCVRACLSGQAQSG